MKIATVMKYARFLNTTLFLSALIAFYGWSTIGAISICAGAQHDVAEVVNIDSSRTSDVQGDELQYVGNKKCRMCHSSWYESWVESSKGGSWESLLAGIKRDAKVAARLNPDEDYTSNANCLKCHSVGFGKPGGYFVPDPTDKRSVRLVAEREGAGCEACHGPGFKYAKTMREILRAGRGYSPKELSADGRHPVGPETCLSCHGHDAPCRSDLHPALSREAMLRKFAAHIANRRGFHDAFPLKYRQPPASTDPANRHSQTQSTAD